MERDPIVTFSIVARDSRNGELGVAVQSHWFSVGSIVSWARAGVGAVATQANVEVSYGPLGLELMSKGFGAAEALAKLLKVDPKREDRQVAMVDSKGEVASHTGSRCTPEAGHVQGRGVSCQGNIMKNGTVWEAMISAYRRRSRLSLSERLMSALEAGQDAGGDLRGKQSASILVVSPERLVRPWEGRVVDLRVEDSPEPLKELRRLIRYQLGYNWLNKGDDFLSSDRVEEAVASYARGMKMLPEVIEAKYWVAVGLLSSGHDRRRGLRLLREVCHEDRNWVQVTRGLIRTGSPPLDPDVLDGLR